MLRLPLVLSGMHPNLTDVFHLHCCTCSAPLRQVVFHLHCCTCSTPFSQVVFHLHGCFCSAPFSQVVFHLHCCTCSAPFSQVVFHLHCCTCSQVHFVAVIIMSFPMFYSCSPVSWSVEDARSWTQYPDLQHILWT